MSVGMFVLALLCFYLPLRYGFVALGHLFSGDSLVSAFAALLLYILTLLATAGVALTALGIGLLRGSRVAHVLTCLLCGILFIGELIRAGETPAYGAAQPAVVTVFIELVCVAVVVALVVPSSVRRFFTLDPQIPLGLAVGWATAVYFGWCIACGGVALVIAGVALGAKFVVWGLLSIIAGVLLISAKRWLSHNSDGARILASAAFAGYAILGFAMAGGSFNTIVPFLVALMGIGGLWLGPEHLSYLRGLQGATSTMAPSAGMSAGFEADRYDPQAVPVAPPTQAGRSEARPPYAPARPHQQPAPDARTNTLAIVAIVLSFTTSIGGIVLGHIALHQIRRTAERGRGLAIAALVVGYGGLLLIIILYIVLAVAVSQAYQIGT